MSPVTFSQNEYFVAKRIIIGAVLGTSLQVLPSLWSAEFLQNWRQEIPQIIAQNS